MILGAILILDPLAPRMPMPQWWQWMHSSIDALAGLMKFEETIDHLDMHHGVADVI